ncbi:hypothetical protein tb265_48260 [Gemmatimonadetes bacterium T265]|nr:hypothetical protein tb265_48260 [Gemmatimonadetes bacterium T265]
MGLLIGVVALGMLAERLTTPRPVVFAIGGHALGVVWHLVPGMRAVGLAPDLALALFLRPVLAWGAFTVPLGAFHANLQWIVLLAFGLVFATTALVAVVARALDPALPWAAAFALGALLAPPDPVAATSVGGRLGLRNRLVTILDGEGMVNDATSLVAFQLAVAAAVTGQFGWGHAGLEFLRPTPIGVGVGLAVAWLTATVRRRLHDPVVETALSLATPYVAHVAAGRARPAWGARRQARRGARDAQRRPGERRGRAAANDRAQRRRAASAAGRPPPGPRRRSALGTAGVARRRGMRRTASRVGTA